MKEHDASKGARVARAMETKGREAPRLQRYPNVTGVGVGFREVGGKLTEEVAVRVYVTKKVPLDALAPDAVLPSDIDGVPVDVIEANFRIHDTPAEHQIRHQMLKGGISIGNIELAGSGTLGAAVFDNISGQQMVLSNWHVLCGRVDCEAGEPIIQPGTGGGDAGTESDLIARLARWQLDDRVDAAVAVLAGYRFCTDDLLNLGRVARSIAGTFLGQRLSKSGRTTGVTSAEVTDVSADVSIDYGPPLGIRTLRNQIVLEGSQVSLPGDSGSVWVDENFNPVGLNFAGSSSTRGIANPMTVVAEVLKINFGSGYTLLDQVVFAAID